MSNLIPMDEAAAILGMSVDEVAELRSNNELFGYRDGSTWKFKMSELERVADDLGLKLNAPGSDVGVDSVKSKIDDAVSELGLSLEDSSEELVLQEPDSVEYMEDSSVELLASELKKPVSESGSFKDSSVKVQDLELLSDDDEGIDLEDSGLLTEGVLSTPTDAKKKSGSDTGNALSLDGDDEDMNLSGSSIFDGEEALSFGSSSLKLAGEKSKKKTGSDTGDLLDDEPSGKGSPSDTGKEGGGGDDLLLADDDLFGDDLSLEDSASFEDSADLSSDFEESDSVELLESDSSAELVLDENDEGVSLAANESGISLSSDQPLELGGSDIDALELDNDDDDDMIVLEDAADPDEATQLKGDDFNLTPLEEAPDAAIEASGSQVVALENSDIYADEGEATVLGEAEFEEAEGLVDVDDDGFGMEEDEYGSTAVAAAGTGGTVVVEAPYNKWQVLSLGLVAAFLSTGGMVAYDLARNMWTPENQTLGRGVLKFFLGLTGMDG